MDNDPIIQNQALDNFRELLTTHWGESKNSADENGKFGIGLCG